MVYIKSSLYAQVFNTYSVYFQRICEFQRIYGLVDLFSALLDPNIFSCLTGMLFPL